MTPIYRSPDRDQTQAMHSLLLDHHIQTSVIETKKSNNASGTESVTWYELWLRNMNELARAKTIITQHEFTTYRTNMSSYRMSVVEQKKRSESIDQAITPSSIKTGQPSPLAEDSKASSKQPLIPSPIVARPGVANPFLARPASDSSETPKQLKPGQLKPGQPRENLIPINNKRVFRRLGLLLGYTEEQIQEWDKNNKLYRPWQADELNETVRRLKEKCS